MVARADPVSLAAAEVGAAKELLRTASATLANGEMRIDGGLALLVDAEKHLAEAGRTEGERQSGVANRVVVVRDALCAHLLAATTLQEAGVAPSVIPAVLYRGVVDWEGGLEGM